MLNDPRGDNDATPTTPIVSTAEAAHRARPARPTLKAAAQGTPRCTDLRSRAAATDRRGRCDRPSAGAASDAQANTGTADNEPALRAKVARVISRFTPTMAPRHWRTIGPFVRRCVLECDDLDVTRVSAQLSVCTRFVYWCHITHHVPLEVGEIFTRERISAYIKAAPSTLVPATVGNHRSLLKSMMKSLNPGAVPSAMPATTPSLGTAPYSAAEVKALWKRVAHIKDAETRRNATVVLAGCLGAGLSGQEVANLRGKHVQIDADGVLLIVGDTTPRAVPVLATLEQILIGVIGALDPEDFLFRPGREETAKNTVSNYLADLKRAGLAIDTSRARATWVVGQLSREVRVEAVMRAMGVNDFTAIHRYLRYTPALDHADYRAQLRAA